MDLSNSSAEFEKKKKAAMYARHFYHRRQLLNPAKHHERLAQMRARNAATRCGRYRPGLTLPKPLQIAVLAEAVRRVHLQESPVDWPERRVLIATKDALPLEFADVRRAICEVFLSTSLYSENWHWLHPDDAGLPATYLCQRWKCSRKLREKVLTYLGL